MKKKILIACEFSGIVRDSFSRMGWDAYSCDLLDTESELTKSEGKHLITDVENILSEDWYMIIAFPPCTHLAASGARWFSEKIKDGRQAEAIRFFMLFANVNCRYVCIENPIGIMSNVYRKPDQILQPWQFGHEESKATCLWLKNLPVLKPTKIMEKRVPRVWLEAPGKDRWKRRSRTYKGIADAMAGQWTEFLM